MSVTIEQDLKEYLAKEFEKVNQELKGIRQDMDLKFEKVNQELKEIRQDITDLKVGQTELKGEITNVKTEIVFIKSDVSSLKTNQNAQIWVLIITVLGTFIKFSFFPNP